MRKQYIFTQESSFTHVKDKGHQEVTEHIIQDDETGALYHHVVSYGSWFSISDLSVFMSHLLKKIGVTGFSESYIADECEIKLPCYPHKKPTHKEVVALPEGIDLESITLERPTLRECKRFKETFLGRTFRIKFKSGSAYTFTGEEILKDILGCTAFKLGDFLEDGKTYPFYTLLTRIPRPYKLESFLIDSDVLKRKEIYQLLDKFTSVDIEKEIKVLEQETKRSQADIKEELIKLQAILKKHLSSLKLKTKKSEVDDWEV